MCPFIDGADARCAARLTLRELSHAFTHCADRYGACPIYQELIRYEDQRKDRVDSPLLRAAS